MRSEKQTSNQLLIEPYGIETRERAHQDHEKQSLLIEPYGIETMEGEPHYNGKSAFNRTIRN